MLKDNLFENVLIKPAVEDGADRLLIVSGYATAEMADWHLATLAKEDKSISVDLIVGMIKRDGIELTDHQALQRISKTGTMESHFACHYVVEGSPVHVKVYIWLKDNKPIKAFMGSANYTKTAFSKSQDEVLMECPPDSVEEIFNSCMKKSVSCLQDGIENKIEVTQKTPQEIPEPPPVRKSRPAQSARRTQRTDGREPAIGWLNFIGIFPPEKEGEPSREASGCGIPIPADGIKQRKISPSGIEKNPDYWNSVKNGNQMKAQLIEMLDDLEPGEVRKLKVMFRAELYKLGEEPDYDEQAKLIGLIPF